MIVNQKGNIINALLYILSERRGSVMVSIRLACRGFDSRTGKCHVIRCKNLTLNIRDCECLSEETLKVVGPFYLVSMPGKVKYPTQGVNVEPVMDSTV